ncbi:putative metallopeptidase [Hathewaya histolytica]|uniref:putative metallopeptidase n=1 Tax=Hathewaya histolytica TaxID=1498 RepID=UPI003B6819AE
MPKISIMNDRTGRIREIECIGYNLQYVTADGEGKVEKIRALGNGKYDCKHWIKNDIYYPMALKIKENLKELSPNLASVNIEKILFLEDTDYVTDEINRETDWVMKIKKAPAQLTKLTGYKFIIVSREFWMERISNEQIIAHIYSCLKQIDEDKLIEPDIKGWKEVLGTLGYGWETTISPVPNLLNGFEDDDFLMLKKADKQIKLDLRNIK